MGFWDGLKSIGKVTLKATATGIGAAATVGGTLMVYAGGTVSLAAASTVALPAAVAGGIAFAGSLGYQYYQSGRSKKDNENKQDNTKVTKQNVIDKMINLNSVGEKKTTLENYTKEFFEASCKYFSEGSNKKGAQKDILKHMKLKPKSLADFQELIRSGIGLFGTEHLEISDTDLDNGFILALRDHINEGGFNKLTTLVLTNNRLTANSLTMLSEIGRKLKLRKLDLSGNRLNSNDFSNDNIQAKWFDEFFRDFHQNFPYLTTLVAQNINLNVDTTASLVALMSNPTLLENLDISRNELGMATLGRVLQGPEFQYNLNLVNIETGLNNEKQVESAIATRKTRIDTLRKSLTGLGSEPITVFLLEKLMKEPSKAHAKELETIFSQQSSSNKEISETIGDKWRLLAKRLKALDDELKLKNKEKTTTELFVGVKRCGKTDISFIVSEQMKRLTHAKKDEPVDLIFNAKGSSCLVTSENVLPELTAALEILNNSKTKPIIKIIDLSHLALSTEQLSNLLVAGLGDYQTTELRLNNNKVTDEFLAELNQSHPDAFRQVKILNLSGNKITVAGLSHLAAYAGNIGLKELNLSENPLTPLTESQQVAFVNVCGSLERVAPSLERLDLTNVGLTKKTLCLVKPLLRNMSFLTALELDQVTNKKYQAYEDLIKDPGFQINLALRRVNTTKNHLSHIKAQMDKKSKSFELFHNSLSPAEKQQPVLTVLLQKFIKSMEPEFPKEINELLDQPFLEARDGFNLSTRKKLWLSARHLQFYRDKAALKDLQFQFTPEIPREEVVALKREELAVFWKSKIKSNPQNDKVEIEKVIEKYREADLGDNILNAYELCIVKLGGGLVLHIFYADDDSLRIVNLQDATQFVLSRHLLAFALNENSITKITYENLAIAIDDEANVAIKIGTNLEAEISGMRINRKLAPNYNPNKMVRFHSLTVVESMQSLVSREHSVAPRNSNASVPIVPQFGQYQAANSSATPAASSSKTTPTRQSPRAQKNR